VGCLGLIAALILTLKPSGDVPYTRLTPDWLTHWINRHGVLRNLFAYALLAVPFLFREPRFTGRLQVVWRLSLFATAVECAQLFIPTRWFEFADIAMSLLGIGSTWVVIEGFWRGARHYHSPIRRLQQHLAIRWRSFTGASKRAL
jgi:VanZ family protein